MEKVKPITLASCIALVVLLAFGLRLYADVVSNVTVTVAILQCSDGLDNDSDTRIDYPLDPGCSSSIDDDETDIAVVYQCQDSVDNDSDGNIDYPADLGCDSATDDSEAGEIAATTGGGSSSGGGIPGSVVLDPTNTQVIFQGTAPVGSSVNVLANGLPVAAAQTLSSGHFGVTVNELSPNVYIFLIYAKDGLGNITIPLSYALKVAKGTVTQLSGIVLDFDTKKKPTNDQGCPLLGDLNGDCRVDLVDFSIASFWWGRQVDASFGVMEKAQLNGDGTIDLEDFSILAYHWTG